MKIYLAGSFAARVRLLKEAERIEKMGHEVLSSWLLEPDEVSVHGERYLRARARIDILEISEASLIFIDTSTLSTAGGYDVELGVCLGTGKPVIIIGPVRNCFQLGLPRFDSWEDFWRNVEKVWGISWAYRLLEAWWK